MIKQLIIYGLGSGGISSPIEVKEDYKYVGYDIWYLEGMVEVLNDEVDEIEYNNTWNSFQKGQLYAYKDMLRTLKEEKS